VNEESVSSEVQPLMIYAERKKGRTGQRRVIRRAAGAARLAGKSETEMPAFPARRA
jgi:hypothetical protein